MQTSLNVTSIDGSNKKSTKSITYVNPEATNAELKTLAQKFNAISTNEYQDAERIDRQSVEEPSKHTPTFTVGTWSTISANAVQATYEYSEEPKIIWALASGNDVGIATNTAQHTITLIFKDGTIKEKIFKMYSPAYQNSTAKQFTITFTPQV